MLAPIGNMLSPVFFLLARSGCKRCAAIFRLSDADRDRVLTSAGLRLPTIVIGVIPIIAVGLDQLRILQARKLAIVESEIASINNLLPDKLALQRAQR